MKNRKSEVLSGSLVVGLLMLSNYSFASLSSKFNQYVGNDSSNLTSLYIIAGVIAIGVIGKLVQHYLMREDEKPSTNVKMSTHSHHRHQRQRIVVKKTS